MARVLLGRVKPVKGVDYLTGADIKSMGAYFAPAAVQAVIPAGSAITFVFDAAEHTALISCRTTKKDNYAVFLYSGYGNGGIRGNVDMLCGLDTGVTYGILEVTEIGDDSFGTNGVTLWNHNDTYVACTVFSLLGSNPTVKDGSMGVTEVPRKWANPPMIIGEEYLTTELWQGKKVYTKLIDCGALPLNDTKNVLLDFTKKTIVDMEAAAIGAPGMYKLPALNETDSTNKIAFWNIGANVYVKTFSTNWDGFNLYVTVKYTKD